MLHLRRAVDRIQLSPQLPVEDRCGFGHAMETPTGPADPSSRRGNCARRSSYLPRSERILRRTSFGTAFSRENRWPDRSTTGLPVTDIRHRGRGVKQQPTGAHPRCRHPPRCEQGRRRTRLPEKQYQDTTHRRRVPVWGKGIRVQVDIRQRRFWPLRFQPTVGTVRHVIRDRPEPSRRRGRTPAVPRTRGWARRGEREVGRRRLVRRCLPCAPTPVGRPSTSPFASIRRARRKVHVAPTTVRAVGVPWRESTTCARRRRECARLCAPAVR